MLVKYRRVAWGKWAMRATKSNTCGIWPTQTKSTTAHASNPLEFLKKIFQNQVAHKCLASHIPKCFYTALCIATLHKRPIWSSVKYHSAALGSPSCSYHIAAPMVFDQESIWKNESIPKDPIIYGLIRCFPLSFVQILSWFNTVPQGDNDPAYILPKVSLQYWNQLKINIKEKNVSPTSSGVCGKLRENACML